METGLFAGTEGGFRIEVSRINGVGAVSVREPLTWAQAAVDDMPLHGVSKSMLREFHSVVIDMSALGTQAAAGLLPGTRALQIQLGCEVAIVLSAEAFSLAENVGHCHTFRNTSEAVAWLERPYRAVRRAA